MDADDLFPSRPDDPLRQIARQDLDAMSPDELDARVAALEAEIERTRARRAVAVAHKSSAEALFKRG